MRCSRRRSRSSTTTPSCPGTRRRSRASPPTPASCCAAGKPEEADAFRETPDMVAARILRGFGTGKGEIVVLNDEAHHCYQDKLLEHPDDEADREDRERNRDARVWFRGLCDLRRKAGIKTVYDLSATPVLPEGLGLQRGVHLPVGGQRLLADGRHRVRHRQDPPHPRRRRRRRQGAGLPAPLGQHPAAAAQAPHAQATGRRARAAGLGDARGARRRAAQPLPQLRAELRPLRSQPGRARRAAAGADRGVPEHDRLQAGLRLDRGPGGRAARRHAAGSFPATSRCSATSRTAPGRTRQRTILIDSEQLESGEPLGADFRRTRRARSRRSSSPTGCATRAPTSTSSPTPTCCARR